MNPDIALLNLLAIVEDIEVYRVLNRDETSHLEDLALDLAEVISDCTGRISPGSLEELAGTQYQDAQQTLAERNTVKFEDLPIENPMVVDISDLIKMHEDLVTKVREFNKDATNDEELTVQATAKAIVHPSALDDETKTLVATTVVDFANALFSILDDNPNTLGMLFESVKKVTSQLEDERAYLISRAHRTLTSEAYKTGLNEATENVATIEEVRELIEIRIKGQEFMKKGSTDQFYSIPGPGENGRKRLDIPNTPSVKVSDEPSWMRHMQYVVEMNDGTTFEYAAGEHTSRDLCHLHFAKGSYRPTDKTIQDLLQAQDINMESSLGIGKTWRVELKTGRLSGTMVK